jgi:hypothetical protein
VPNPDAGRPAPGEPNLAARDGKDGLQLVRPGRRRIGPEAEEVFLDRLAASCNVAYAAAGAGFSKEAFYARRRRDPGFAARWDSALAQGYVRIEALLIDNAEQALAGRAPDPESPIPPMTARDAIMLLQLHQARVAGTARRPGWAPRPRALDEVRESILAKLAAFDRARDRARRDSDAPDSIAPAAQGEGPSGAD